MKKQIVIIHGGTSFKTYEDYISYLKNKEISIEKLKPCKDWKDTLATELGEDYEVLMPRMPNSTNARYDEWKLWFSRVSEFFDDKVILIGHSLGGIFLAKYLSENTLTKTIKAVILVATPYDDSDDVNGGESLIDFLLPVSLNKFMRQANAIFLIHSKDDPVVPFVQLAKYQTSLPKAKVVIFENRKHFNQETFPEIIKIIKSV